MRRRMDNRSRRRNTKRRLDRTTSLLSAALASPPNMRLLESGFSPSMASQTAKKPQNRGENTYGRLESSQDEITAKLIERTAEAIHYIAVRTSGGDIDRTTEELLKIARRM